MSTLCGSPRTVMVRKGGNYWQGPGDPYPVEIHCTEPVDEHGLHAGGHSCLLPEACLDDAGTRHTWPNHCPND